MLHRLPSIYNILLENCRIINTTVRTVIILHYSPKVNNLSVKNAEGEFVKMNELQTFTNDVFGVVRTTIINNEPYFVGKDVADALGYSDTSDAIKRHVEVEDKLTRRFTDSGQNRSMYVINESGLYSLIFGSKLPSAKQFKRWVTSEVLPQIRKTGGYIPVGSQDDDLSIMSKAHQILERTLQEKDRIIEAKQNALRIAQPKADLYDKLMNADGYFSFNVAAKELGTGRNRLMKTLRDKGILFRDGLSNIAYQKYCNSGYFVVKHSIGKNGIACGVTKVTPKGLEYIYRVINENGSMEVAR